LLCGLVSGTVTSTLRWMTASRRAGRTVPPGQFYRRVFPGRRGQRPAGLSRSSAAAMLVLMAAMVVFGPGVGVASLAHGLEDSNLVAHLREHGIRTSGFLIDVQDVETAGNGGTSVTNMPILEFKDR
jgi:hypothetical protein